MKLLKDFRIAMVAIFCSGTLNFVSCDTRSSGGQLSKSGEKISDATVLERAAGENVDVSGNVKVQNGSDLLDTISSKEILVSDIGFFSLRKGITKSFGEPDSLTHVINEFNGDSSIYVYYKKSYFEIKGQRMIGFSVADSQFWFLKEKIKINDRVALLQKIFPKSFASRYLIDEGIEVVKLGIGTSDEYLLFKVRDGRIIECRTWVDW